MNIKKVSKKLLSVLLILILLFGFVSILPITVKAVTTSGLKFYKPDGTGNTTIYQKIYYANNLWRVLDVDTDEHNELFLLSDAYIRHGIFSARNTGSSYETSAVRTHLADVFMNNFSDKEQSAISKQYVLDDIGFQGEGVSTPSNDGDSVFLLSLAELRNSIYFPNGNMDRIIGISWWWLRSAGSSDELALGVDSNGEVGEGRIYIGNKVSPGLKLDLSSILLASTISGEHSKSTTIRRGFSVLSPTVSDEVKLTILDTTQVLSANMSATAAAEDGKLYVDNYSYTGVPTQNGYLSAIFDDGNGNTYYSKIMKITNGTGNGENLAIDLTGVPLGDYTLKLFTEQANGDTETDYASNMVDFTGIEVDPVAVEEIKLDDTLELGVDRTYTLIPTFTPRNSTNQNVTWTSSDDTVAKVDSEGKVEAIRIGTTTITVTALDGGFTYECEVTVNVPVTEITLDETELTLNVGDTATLTATIYPNNATNQNVTWTSSDESVAIVDENGNVIAIGAGNVTITVKTNNNKTAICMVTVTEPAHIDIPVSGITLDETDINLEIGMEKSITVTIAPVDATNQEVLWSYSNTGVVIIDTNRGSFVPFWNTYSNTGVVTIDTNRGSFVPFWNTYSNTDVVTVDSTGLVKAVGEGRTTITVTTVDGGKIAICEVTVTASASSAVPVSGVTLNTNTLEIEIDDSYTLGEIITPNNATDRGVTWTSDDDTVATVDNNGKVKAIKTGKAIITVTTVDGNFTATCEVTVTVPTRPKTPSQIDTYTQIRPAAKVTTSVTDVFLNKNTMSLTVGGSEVLVAAIVPTNSTNQDVIWTSSDEMIAVVDSNGNITAIGVGTATITVSSVDGNKTDICTVTVKSITNATQSTLPSNMYTTSPKVPATGDTSVSALLFIGLFSSIFCIITALIFNRKHSYK